jgi:hypothetical protein
MFDYPPDAPEPPRAESSSPETRSCLGQVCSALVGVNPELARSSSSNQAEEAFEGGWDVRPNSSETSKSDLAWQTRPGYVLAGAAYSTRVLQNLDGQVLMSRDHRSPNDIVDEETVRWLREARVSHPKVLDGIAKERDRLRLSIDSLATACANMPYGYDWFHSGFQATVANLKVSPKSLPMQMKAEALTQKDVYAARVAQLFMEHLGLSEDEAINEAMSISWTDGLHSCDMAWLDGDQKLQVDFAVTVTENTPFKGNSSTSH